MKRISVVVAAVSVLAAASLAGCSTFSGLLSQLIRGTSGSGTAAASTAETGTAQAAPSPQSAPAASEGASSQAVQAQFSYVYAVAAPFGGYRIGESGFKPGEGTVWEFTNQAGGKKVATFEHALLKINSDGTQWWRAEVVSGKDTLLYEFLMGSDGVVQKVRFKDPDTGKIIEFVPTSPQGGAAAVPPGAGFQPGVTGAAGEVSRNQERVTVKAGTFQAEHVTYTDEKGRVKSETWTAANVPGGIVKIRTTDLRSGKVSGGELVKIETGVTTQLQSY